MAAAELRNPSAKSRCHYSPELAVSSPVLSLLGIAICERHWPRRKGNEEMTMRRMSGQTLYGGARTSGETWWVQHREASLNWLALGLLLAAWNTSDNEAATDARRRPESLRAYSYVSVRAASSMKL
jgi:hypothetical protein